jgi:hypothetical protein
MKRSGKCSFCGKTLPLPGTDFIAYCEGTNEKREQVQVQTCPMCAKIWKRKLLWLEVIK